MNYIPEDSGISAHKRASHLSQLRRGEKLCANLRTAHKFSLVVFKTPLRRTACDLWHHAQVG